jgi:hypothetical protein
VQRKSFAAKTLPDPKIHHCEMVIARDGQPFILFDGEAIAHRGNIAWVSLKKGFAVFDDDDGRGFNSQTYTHCWLVWPERGKRNSNKETRVERASQHVEVQPWH